MPLLCDGCPANTRGEPQAPLGFCDCIIVQSAVAVKPDSGFAGIPPSSRCPVAVASRLAQHARPSRSDQAQADRLCRLAKPKARQRSCGRTAPDCHADRPGIQAQQWVQAYGDSTPRADRQSRECTLGWSASKKTAAETSEGKACTARTHAAALARKPIRIGHEVHKTGPPSPQQHPRRDSRSLRTPWSNKRLASAVSTTWPTRVLPEFHGKSCLGRSPPRRLARPAARTTPATRA